MTTANTCTLSTGEYTDRMEWIAASNRDALLAAERSGGILRLHYSLGAEDRVLELVRRDSLCCGFLSFTVERADERVMVSVEASAGSESAAQPLFDQFSALIPTGAGCGCSSATPAPVGEGSGRAAAGTSATAAAVCGVCCVVPFAFPAIALTTFGAGVAAVAGVYWWAIRLAFLAVIAGWTWLLADAVRHRRLPGSGTVVSMLSATAFALLAYGWSFIEPYVINWVRQG